MLLAMPSCTAARGTVGLEPASPPRLTTDSVRDKIEGAWLGQMIGVTWGFPTEFYARYIHGLFPDLHQRGGEPFNIYAAYEGGPIPLDELPAWAPGLINGGYTQDDLYVEVPFMRAMETHGVNATWHHAARAFGDSRFPLYHANLTARDNLRGGLAAPWSGHYKHSQHADDIDWQIEADFIGLMCPGQPRTAAEIAFRLGHVMNHGDGVYGGVFVAATIADAFTAPTVLDAANTGRLLVPLGSTYRQALDQVHRRWVAGVPYQANLTSLYEDWGTDDRCPEWGGDSDPLNIDAKLNGAFILLGLLYGEGDLASSMRFAMAAGQDSDCNPSNVGSVLGAFYGGQRLGELSSGWLSALDRSQRFQTTTSTLDQLIDLNLGLAQRVVTFRGGAAPGSGPWSVPGPANADPLILEQWPETPSDAPSLEVRLSATARTLRVDAATDPDSNIQVFFGDLSFASGPTHSHTYRAPGRYHVTVFAADPRGVINFHEHTVTIE